MTELRVDPNRRDMGTGIFVRAKNGDSWVSADVSTLDTASLLTWLRSRGGSNLFAENTVLLLLGHTHD